MAAKPNDFNKTLNAIIGWTIVYVVLIYAAMRFVFRINPLDSAFYNNIFSSGLHGFAHFAFGLMLVAALPIYIAALFVIIRQKKSIIENPVKPLVQSPKSKVNSNQPNAHKSAEEEKPVKLPAGLPDEMKEQYIRMTKGSLIHAAATRISKPSVELKEEATTVGARGNAPKAPNKSDQGAFPRAPTPLTTDDLRLATGAVSAPGVTNTDAASMLPIPDDFSFGDEPQNPMGVSAPAFREISFGGGNKETGDRKQETGKNTNTNTESEIEFIERKGKRYAVYTHSDPEFWVADDDNWFASGKQIDSPTKKLIAAAATAAAEPVLVLKSENIMDLPTRRAEWDLAGIRVIGDISEL